ncbi:unnamed protein product [Ectocarpus fasciculatus]
MEFKTGNVAVAVKTGDSDMSESEDQQFVSPHDTEDREEEHESSHDGDVASDFGNADSGSADQERQEEAEGTLRIDGGKGKEEEEEQGEMAEQQHEEEEDDEEDEENARRGKRTLGVAAKPPRRYSVRTAGSRRPNYAERPGCIHRHAMPYSISDGVEPGDVPVSVEPIRGRDSAEIGEEEQEEQEEKATRGKRKLGGTGKASRRQNVRAAGSGHPNYAERPAQEERPKRQRTASEPGVREQGGDIGAAVALATSTPMIARRNEQKGRPSCKEHGCTKQPSFGKEGSKKRQFCAQHAKQGMVSLVSRRCGHPGCMKQSSFGKGGSQKREFCSLHAKAWDGQCNIQQAPKSGS